MLQSFGWQMFRRVGSSLIINRIYKVILTLSSIIQLSLFFILTSIASWLDQLWSGAIGHLAVSPLYQPLLIVILVVSIEDIFVGQRLTDYPAIVTSSMAYLCENPTSKSCTVLNMSSAGLILSKAGTKHRDVHLPIDVFGLPNWLGCHV